MFPAILLFQTVGPTPYLHPPHPSTPSQGSFTDFPLQYQKSMAGPSSSRPASPYSTCQMTAYPILLTVDGLVHTQTFTQAGVSRKEMVSHAQGVAELGVSVCSSLDFSFP